MLLEEVDGLADRCTVATVAREPIYSELDLVQELRSTSRVNLEVAVQVIAAQVPEGVDPAESSRQTGRLRARQGVPLEAVLRAYRIGGRLIWESLLELSRGRFGGAYDEPLLDAAGYVWRTNDGSSAVVVDAYRREELRLHSHDLSRRQTMLDGLIDGRGGDPAFLRDAATVLGLPVTGPLLCVVAFASPTGDEALHAPQEVLATHGLVSVFHQRPHDEVGLIALGVRPEQVALEALRTCVEGRVGVSPVLDGLAAVDTGYRMAHTAARTMTAGGLAVLDERLPEALLVDSPELVARLVHTALGGLLELPESDRDILLETLGELLASGGSPTHAAAALFCHRNTVIYRMRRIEAATGRAIADPRDRLLLTLGLMAARADAEPPTGR